MSLRGFATSEPGLRFSPLFVNGLEYEIRKKYGLFVIHEGVIPSLDQELVESIDVRLTRRRRFFFSGYRGIHDYLDLRHVNSLTDCYGCVKV